jgi:hypothetical protein
LERAFRKNGMRETVLCSGYVYSRSKDSNCCAYKSNTAPIPPLAFIGAIKSTLADIKNEVI